MDLTRRELLSGLGSAAVGGLRVISAQASLAQAHRAGPSNRLVSIDQLDAIISGLKADGLAFTTVSKFCRLK